MVTRCLISSHSLALVKGEHFLNYLEKKSFRPIFDANSKPLKILGAIQLDVRIEKFTAKAEFLCYQGTNQTALLGFLTMKDENLLVYPKLGLFCCNAPTDASGDACFVAEEDRNVELTVEQQQLLLPVAATAALDPLGRHCQCVYALASRSHPIGAPPRSTSWVMGRGW